MKGKLKQTKGITLIALIITIIILLILAVVSIRLVMNDGILGKSEKAVKAYSESETEEKVKLAYSDYQMGKLTDSSYTFEQALQNGKVAYTSVTGSDAEGYIVTTTLSDGRTKQYNVTSAGVSKIKDLEDYGVKVGDYVNYTYDTVSDGYALTKSYSGYESDQTITQSTGLKWRVLGLDKNGNIELISATPSKSNEVYLQGSTGYNNGVYLINDICKKLYSNSKLGITARSLNLEDIEEQFSDEGKNARDSYTENNSNTRYGETKSISDSGRYYPLIYAQEAGSGVNGTIREGGIGKSDPFYTEETNLSKAYDADGNELITYKRESTALKVTQTCYYLYAASSYFENDTFCNMIFGTPSEYTNYWLASRWCSTSMGVSYRFVNGEWS